MPLPAITAGQAIVGAAIGGGILGSRSSQRAANVQASAIADSQQILADSNIKAAELVMQGQMAAAGAIESAGERAAMATLEAAGLAREQIERFFTIAKADIKEKLDMSRADITTGMGTARGDINKGVKDAKGQLAPFRTQGLIASRDLASMLGIADDRGQTREFNQQRLEALPQYQFQLDQGMKAIDRGSRSKLSGGQLKDLQAYGNGLASNVFNDRIQTLLGLDNLGFSAAAGMANADMQGGSGLANIAMTGAGMRTTANQNASSQLASAAGGAGSQNASIAMNTGNSLSNIALGTGSALANNSTAGANALAGLQSQYGSDLANLTLGAGTARANGITGSANSWTNALNTAALGYGMFGGNGLFNNPLQTSKGITGASSYSPTWGSNIRLG